MTTVPAPHTDPTTLEEELLSLLGERLLDLPSGFGVESRLADAGFDSMAVIQLLLLLEDRFGLWLPEADLVPENLETTRSLAALLARRLASGGAA